LKWPKNHRRLFGNQNEAELYRETQQGTTPSPTAQELKKVTQGLLPDLIVHSFIVITKAALLLIFKSGDR
jgi:hypothetical protein